MRPSLAYDMARDRWVMVGCGRPQCPPRGRWWRSGPCSDRQDGATLAGALASPVRPVATRGSLDQLGRDPVRPAIRPPGPLPTCLHPPRRRSDQTRAASTTARAPRSPTGRREPRRHGRFAAALACGSRESPAPPPRHPRSVPARPRRARTLCRVYARPVSDFGSGFGIENWVGGSPVRDARQPGSRAMGIVAVRLHQRCRIHRTMSSSV